MDPVSHPQVHFLVLSYCDLETLKTARLVNKAWCIASTTHIRQKSIVDLTNSNLHKFVETLDQNRRISRIDTFPSTSFRIRKTLRLTSSFARLFGYYGPNLLEMLESGVNPFVETFAHCHGIILSQSVLTNLKNFKIARIYNGWGKHSYVASERIEIRTSMYETLFAMAPNLDSLKFDTRMGPSEWLRFMQFTTAKFKQLRHLGFSLFVGEDTEDYFADGELRKDVKLDQRFLQGLPGRVKQLGFSGLNLESLSCGLMSDDGDYKLHLEHVQSAFELMGLVKDTIRHLEVTFCFIDAHIPDTSLWAQTVDSSFPVLPRLESLKLHFQYTEAAVLPKIPLNKLPSLKKLTMSFMSGVLAGYAFKRLDMDEWLPVFKYPNTSVEVLDMQDFTLLAFSPEMLRGIPLKFLTLTTLKMDFHPTSTISAENLKTIFVHLRRLEKLCIRILGSSKDFFLEFPILPCDKLMKVLDEGCINLTEILTGIPKVALKQLQETASDSLTQMSTIPILRISPSLVDMERLRVLQIEDQTRDGILNDEICRFGIMHMKSLRELCLSSTQNISEDCLEAMKQVLDIKKCVKTPRNTCSRVAPPPVEDDDDSDCDSL